MQAPDPLEPRESATLWRAAGYEDMDLLRATFVTHRFALHYHEEFVFGVVERGGYEFHFQGGRRRIRAGQVLVINPGEVHSGYATDAVGWSYRSFYPSARRIRRLTAEITGRRGFEPRFRGPIVDDPDLARRLGRLHRSLECPPDRLRQDELLREVLALYLRRHARQRPPHGREGAESVAVDRARQYLHAHLESDVSLGDLAVVTGLSPFHLSRVFRRQLGLPPHKYLTLIRVRRARQLLTSGWGIAQTAAAVGFADQSHLTRWFKRVFGVPPGRYLGGER